MRRSANNMRNRRPSRRGFRGRSRSQPPKLDTVYEAVCDNIVDAVPAQEEALAAGALEPMAGALRLRPLGFAGWAVRLLLRRPWLDRYAVLQIGSSGSPPHLLLFQNAAMEQLHEDILLQPPIQLYCLPSDNNLMRFALSGEQRHFALAYMPPLFEAGQ